MKTTKPIYHKLTSGNNTLSKLNRKVDPEFLGWMYDNRDNPIIELLRLRVNRRLELSKNDNKTSV